MKTLPFRYTIGSIDGLNVVGNRLNVDGWAVSLENAPITELRVAIDGLPVSSGLACTLPSPDVHAAFPAIEGTKNCRFAIAVDLSEAQMGKLSEGGLISLVPWTGGVPGVPWEHVWLLRLPFPVAAESVKLGWSDLAISFSFFYDDDWFSFVLPTSLFTHMVKAEVANYLKEFRRVIREDGRCLVTFFIIDDEAEALIRQKRSSLDIRHEMPDGTFVTHRRLPEMAAGYREADL